MKATIDSLRFMTNWRTKIVHFLFMPLINAMLLVLIDMQFETSFSWNIACASILMSGALTSIDCMVSSFTTDRNLGIDREMLAKKRFSIYYWGTKICVSAAMTAILICINMILLVIIGGTAVPWFQTLTLMPQVIAGAVIIGFVSGISAWTVDDPYFFSNLFSSFANIVSGVLVIITAYPTWLRYIGFIFPFSHSLRILHDVDSPYWTGWAVSGIWAIAGCVLYVIQSSHVKRQARFSTL